MLARDRLDKMLEQEDFPRLFFCLPKQLMLLRFKQQGTKVMRFNAVHKRRHLSLELKMQVKGVMGTMKYLRLFFLITRWEFKMGK